MTQRIWGKIIAGVAGAVALVTLASAPATAETATATAPAASAASGDVTILAPVEIGLTTREGNYIWGYGRNSGPGGGNATIEIQRERWWGWETLVSHTFYGSGYNQHISYNCSGTGIYNYRTYIYSENGSGQLPSTKSSNVIRESC